MNEFVLQYYAMLSSLTSTLSEPLTELSYAVNIPLLSALILGLLGATSPCQLSTNVAALAFISRNAAQPGRAWASALAYLAGKLTVYTLVGGVVVLLGLQLDRMSIPVIVAVRKAMGPLLILIGLLMLGVLTSRISVGNRLSAWLEQRFANHGVVGAYGLGLAFSLAFCPTLFWLFFGLTIPLALSSTGGVVFPAIFALGTTLPLLFFVALAITSADSLGTSVRQVKRFDRVLSRVAGIVFLVVGLNEIILYWLA